jgi:hypothetical protein
VDIEWQLNFFGNWMGEIPVPLTPFIILSVSTQYPFADSPFNFLSFSIELFVLRVIVE